MAAGNPQHVGSRNVRARLYFIALSATVKFVADMPRNASVAGRYSARLATSSMCADRAARPRTCVCRNEPAFGRECRRLFFLHADLVGLAEPGEDFCVEVFLARDAELIEVIVRREELRAGESQTLDPVLEPKASD
jgi:hypothetical protein